MSSRSTGARLAVFAFVLALLLKGAVPLLATWSAHLQGKGVAEVCDVYGVALPDLAGVAAPSAHAGLASHAGHAGHALPGAHDGSAGHDMAAMGDEHDVATARGTLAMHEMATAHGRLAVHDVSAVHGMSATYVMSAMPDDTSATHDTHVAATAEDPSPAPSGDAPSHHHPDSHTGGDHCVLGAVVALVGGLAAAAAAPVEPSGGACGARTWSTGRSGCDAAARWAALVGHGPPSIS